MKTHNIKDLMSLRLLFLTAYLFTGCTQLFHVADYFQIAIDVILQKSRQMRIFRAKTVHRMYVRLPDLRTRIICNCQKFKRRAMQ